MSEIPATFWLDRTYRARLQITGPDRAKFLHNLCTNDIKALRPGQGLEAFITNLQGKTLGYVTVLAGADALFLRTEANGFEAVLPHFAKYGIFDDVAWDDLSASTFEIHVAGEMIAEVATALDLELPGPRVLNHHEGGIRVIRDRPFGIDGVTIVGDIAQRDRVLERLAGIVELTEDQSETLRIEAGTPAFGRDVLPENLPQEIGRDALAISFVKGCYLGQETVARLDALGHVNKILKGLRIPSSDVPAAGSRLLAGSDVVGRITSSAKASAGTGGVALAIVRVKSAEPGNLVTWDHEGTSGEAIVVDLPKIPVAVAGETS